ncbi:MAG TPA: lipid-A-disaccharide synthase [Alphaproteobacteria bacterium]|nr:lipid-A-disaccharide synthase [Alphaproteobacteria bacterium]
MSAGSAGGSAAPHIFLVAGEPSGDALGGRLMAALKRATQGRVRFSGVGGERMACEGLDSLFALDDIAVMGLTEVLPRLPRILGRLRETVRAVASRRPQVVVTIDAPSFTLRVASQVRKLGIPVVHYVAPQLWAWRPGRARQLAQKIDHLMVVLPFEPEFFAEVGVPCTYVGHPAIEEAGLARDGAAFRRRNGIPTDAPLLAVLPGSRRGLAERMLPIFGEAARRLHARHDTLHVVTLVVTGTAELVAEATRRWGAHCVSAKAPDDKRDALAAAAAAITTSGTATLELAIAGVPMVVAYRASPVTAFLARRMIEVDAFALPNLVAGRLVAPELMQENCTVDRLVAEVGRLLDDAEARRRQIAGWGEVRAKLGVSGPSPSDRAARVVLAAAGVEPGSGPGIRPDERPALGSP